jgi:hypothetical protein
LPKRFLDSREITLLPGALDRLRDRCPGLPADVIALLEDVYTCLTRTLYRPAVAVMGVAYEAAVEAVATALLDRGKLAPQCSRRERGEAHFQHSTSDRDTAAREKREGGREGSLFRVRRAYDFAEELRRRRNDASHTRPRYCFDDHDEVEELFASAARHLPLVWSLTSLP